MDFAIPEVLIQEMQDFDGFLDEHLRPNLAKWNQEREIPRDFYEAMGRGGWLGFGVDNGRFFEESALKQTLIMEALAKVSPGVAVAVLVVSSLGMKGFHLFGSEKHRQAYAESAIRGETLFCVGNTERQAGSDVASVEMTAEKVEGGWKLNGAKGYVTNGLVSDLALVTAITDPEAKRSRRLSLFLVDLSSEGVSRTKLNKQVWIPSDLTRVQLDNVVVPDENLIGTRGKGLSHILEIFTNSRITISGLTLGTAVGAFELGKDRAKKRKIFGKRIADFQAKSFEMAELYAKIEAARLMLWKACWAKDRGQEDFRLDASMAKYLNVEIARQVSQWAADLFGAASVVYEHPVHKFPMDAWAASLGEGTQDVQKLVIFREIMKQ